MLVFVFQMWVLYLMNMCTFQGYYCNGRDWHKCSSLRSIFWTDSIYSKWSLKEGIWYSWYCILKIIWGILLPSWFMLFAGYQRQNCSPGWKFSHNRFSRQGNSVNLVIILILTEMHVKLGINLAIIDLEFPQEVVANFCYLLSSNGKIVLFCKPHKSIK